MIEVIPLGHASLAVRGSQTVLCDPIFADHICRGGNLIDPPRRIREHSLGRISAIFLTHHHSDHYDPELLARLAVAHAVPVVVPEDSVAAASLSAMGVNIVPVRAGARLEVAGFEVTATPSAVPFPEVGYAFRHKGALFLNLADTIVRGTTLSLADLADAPDLVFAPFQAGGYMSFLPLRIGGPPPGLEKAIAVWAKEWTLELVREIVNLRPACVVPFADGIAYRDQRINHWHFPLPDAAFIRALQEAGLHAEELSLGSSYKVSSRSVMAVPHAQEIEIHGARSDRQFDPRAEVGDVPEALTAAPRASASDNDVCARLRSVVRQSAIRTEWTDWELELCEAGHNTRTRVFIEVTQHDVTVHAERGAVPRSPFGVRMHRIDLMQMLDGELGLENIELGGAFRYWSPSGEARLEQLRESVLTPLRVLDPANRSSEIRRPALTSVGAHRKLTISAH